jgi:uncharacterized membrane protein HdeD (DUF308 family)
MSMSESDLSNLQQAVAASLHEHWSMFLAEGILLVILGAAAIVIPPLATIAVSIFIGWIFLIGGVFGLIGTIRMRRAPGFVWSLVSAVVGIVAGLILLGWPIAGAVSLTLVLIGFFIVEGVASIMFGLDHKRELSGRWGWLVFNGVMDLVLAVLVLAGFPASAAWAIGLLVGIDMLIGGWALIAMALHARKAKAA